MDRRSFLKHSLSSVALAPLISFNPPENLPKILILGDSISIGYTPYVQKMMAGTAWVTRPYFDKGNAENCQGTTNGVKSIDRWVSDTDWDIIHFNFGLHDLKHVHPETGKNSQDPKHPQQADVRTYKKNLTEIVGRLKQTQARLVFATTTPYPDVPAGPLRRADQPAKYNKVALQIMQKNKIEVNNLHDFVLPRMEELMIANNVHFTKDGSAVLAAEVVKYLK